MSNIIRLATPADSEAILEVYAPYVRDTAISFETAVPTADEFSKRIENICQVYPYLVYLADDKIIGFCYASRHREREAYRYNAEVSIYVMPQYHSLGAAHKLYKCLFNLLKYMGYYNVYAAYTVPNNKSSRFHQKFGFAEIGTHPKTGYKLGLWRDVTWLHKALNDYDTKPGAIKLIGDIPLCELKNIIAEALRES